MSDTNDIADRSTDLEEKYRGAGALTGKKPLACAATDLRHALGMEKPARSLNKTVCARVVSLAEDGDLGRAGLLEAENTASDLRESLAGVIAADETPTSLGPVVYDLLAAVEKASDAETVATLAIENKTDDEVDFEESYLARRNEAAEEE